MKKEYFLYYKTLYLKFYDKIKYMNQIKNSILMKVFYIILH